ncbi:terminase [Siculibacillus lacustris]|uniref:Terminase n=1 Tax=Siculibacillus lacustris TaxID=1549641 RepID=A0A4Q9VGR3_9HYPH|nr:terminase gpA endonuclease subunit [Siculibacillus lacustris]TBW33365.1 terminase [Siculibacillus lacustris]
MFDERAAAARLAEIRGEFPGIVHGRTVLFDALITAARPEEELTVSEWADRYRKISPESGSPYPGDWRTARVPYLRQPLDCLHPDHPARRVTLKFSAQTGKSEVGVCWFGYIVDRSPGPMLTVLPTGEEAAKYNRVKLQPTVDASPRIRHRVRPENSRDEGASTTAFKRFAGGYNQITSATSSKGLQMVSIRWLILDEVAGYPKDADGRGSPVDQARARTKSYGDRAKELEVSTPGLVGDCRISEDYDAGDRRRLYMPCPQCGAFQVWGFDKMRPPTPASKNRPHFACEAEGCIVDQVSRDVMLAAHRWVPTWVAEGEPPVPTVIAAADIDLHAIEPCSGRVRDRQPSWANWSAWSPFEPWSDIWARSEAAHGDPGKEKVVTQQDLGEAWEPKSDTPDWEKLLEVRRAWTRGVVPYPAAVLYGFVDVQGNRFEWGLWAFGPGFQAWLVDRGVIAHEHTTAEAWNALDALTARQWTSEGGRDLDVMAWGIDTGAFTQALYDKVSKRHGLQATKSDNRPSAAPYKLTRADLRDVHGRPIAGRRIDLGLVGAWGLKVSVYEGLRHLVAGPRSDGTWPNATIHLPDWIGEDELRQLTAEVLVDTREEARGNARRQSLVKIGDAREWRKRHHWPNEGLDIAVGCRALAWGDGAGQIDRKRWDELVAAAHGPRAPETPQGELFASTLVAAPPQPASEPDPVLPPPLPPRPTFVPRRSGWLKR